MDPIRVDLVSLRRPVEFQFPNDKWFVIEPFRGPGKAMLLTLRRDPEANVGLVMELLRLAVPSATDEDFDSLSTDEDVWRVIAAADGKAAQMEAFLKNAVSDGAYRVPSPTPPSSLTTTSSTPSEASPGSTASPSNQFTKVTGTRPSRPTRRSRRSSASTDSTRTDATSATSASP
jgi:hypothetical protein